MHGWGLTSYLNITIENTCIIFIYAKNMSCVVHLMYLFY